MSNWAASVSSVQKRHESRRIDNQPVDVPDVRGDPGQTQFFISLEDELMRLFGGERMQKIVDRMGLEEDEAIEAGMLSKSIEGAPEEGRGQELRYQKIRIAA